MSQRILITGAYGYVGGRVAQTLSAGGAAVSLGTRQEQVSPPAWLPSAQVVHLDWRSNAALQSVCAGTDAIVHLAAMNEVDAARDLQGALEVNGMWSLRLLEAAQAAGVRRFVYLSTAHVYGAPLTGVIDESRVPRPGHPYAVTHKVAEDFVLAAHDSRRIEGVVLRLSNGFGAPAHPAVNRWTLLVNDLCRQAVATRTLVLQSAGLQQRDFITLEDAASAIAHVLALPPDALGDGLFNLGGDASMRVIDMAELIAARCQVALGFTPVIKRPEPRGVEKQAGEAQAGEAQASLVYSTEKLKRTGWLPARRHVIEVDATLALCARLA